MSLPPNDETPPKRVALPPVDKYRLISEAVERGVSYGYRRAHKHTNTPSEEMIFEQIQNAILFEITEVFQFGHDVEEE